MSITPPETAPADPYGPHKQIISSIYEFTPDALEQLAVWIEQRGLRTPIANVVGYQTDRLTTCKLVDTVGGVTLANGPVTDVIFSAATYDPGKLWNGTTAIIPKVGGMYIVTGTYFFAANAVNFRELDIQIGHVSQNVARTNDATASGIYFNATGLVILKAGDSMTLGASQTSGGNLAGCGGGVTQFSCALVSRF